MQPLPFYYIAHSKENGQVIDGSGGHDWVYENDGRPNDYQKWRFAPDDNDDYFMMIKKKQGDNRCLDGRTGSDEVYQNWWLYNQNQHWKPEDAGDGFVKLVNQKSGLVITGKGHEHNVKQESFTNADTQKWQLELADTDFTVEFVDIQYGQPSSPVVTKPVDIVTKRTIENRSNATLREVVSNTIERNSIFEFGLSSTVTVGATVGMEVGVPGLGTATGEVSAELSLTAHVVWTDSETLCYGISQEVEVPPQTAVEVHGWIDWTDNYLCDFTMILWISATGYDTSGNTRPLTTDELEQHIDNSGFSGQVLDRTHPNKLEVSIDGTFSGSYGMETHFTSTPL